MKVRIDLTRYKPSIKMNFTPFWENCFEIGKYIFYLLIDVINRNFSTAVQFSGNIKIPFLIPQIIYGNKRVEFDNMVFNVGHEDGNINYKKSNGKFKSACKNGNNCYNSDYYKRRPIEIAGNVTQEAWFGKSIFHFVIHSICSFLLVFVALIMALGMLEIKLIASIGNVWYVLIWVLITGNTMFYAFDDVAMPYCIAAILFGVANVILAIILLLMGKLFLAGMLLLLLMGVIVFSPGMVH